MDKLTQRLNEEMSSWIGDLVTNSDLSSEKLLKRYSYEYCIKEEIINYFSENIISGHKKSGINYHEKQKNMKKFQKTIDKYHKKR